MDTVSFLVVADQDRVDVEVGLIFPLVGFDGEPGAQAVIPVQTRDLAFDHGRFPRFQYDRRLGSYPSLPGEHQSPLAYSGVIGDLELIDFGFPQNHVVGH